VKKSVLLPFLLLIVLPFSACSKSSTADIQAKLGQEFSLAIGQNAEIPSEKMQIKFLAVTGDSRCPSGAQCIWAGEANCSMTITLDNREKTVTLTQPGGSSPALTSFEGYSLSFNLTPYPQIGKSIEDEDYQLFLTVMKTED
jgi:hypothetical protein